MSPTISAGRSRFSVSRADIAAYRRIRPRDWLTFATIVSFAAGLLTNIRFQFGGRASLGEITLAMVAIFAVLANLGNRRFWNRRVVLMLLALTIAFGGYILSDLLNATPLDRLYRGWARIAFVTVDFLAVWALSRNSIANLCALCVGDACSALLHYGAEHPDFLYNYKFHLAMPLTVLLMIAMPLIAPRSAPKATGIAMIAVGMMHVWFDFRMAGAICILVGFVLLARCLSVSRFRSLYVILLFLALVSSSVAIGMLISATNPEFGSRRHGSNSERLSLAMAGVSAIERSPLLGRGSWAWDHEMNNVYASYWNRPDPRDMSVGETKAPHSQFIQVWAEAGLLGMVFICSYGTLLAKALWMLFFKRPLDLLSPLFLFYLLLATWDLFFSPFANLHRFLIGLALVVAIQVLRERDAFVPQTPHAKYVIR